VTDNVVTFVSSQHIGENRMNLRPELGPSTHNFFVVVYVDSGWVAIGDNLQMKITALFSAVDSGVA